MVQYEKVETIFMYIYQKYCIKMKIIVFEQHIFDDQIKDLSIPIEIIKSKFTLDYAKLFYCNLKLFVENSSEGEYQKMKKKLENRGFKMVRDLLHFYPPRLIFQYQIPSLT